MGTASTMMATTAAFGFHHVKAPIPARTVVNPSGAPVIPAAMLCTVAPTSDHKPARSAGMGRMPPPTSAGAPSHGPANTRPPTVASAANHQNATPKGR